MLSRVFFPAILFALFALNTVQAKGLITNASDSTAQQDSIWRDPGRKQDIQDSTVPVAYVKREYDHKQQVIVGGVVMLCVALALVGMNNYNPRR